jgi:hypothetical protein
MRHSETLKLVALLKAAWPTVAIEPATVRLYAESLTEYDYDDALEGVRTVITIERFWPAVATLRAAIGAVASARETITTREEAERHRANLKAEWMRLTLIFRDHHDDLTSEIRARWKEVDDELRAAGVVLTPPAIEAPKLSGALTARPTS